ncbi:hypothetical protein CDAR_575291 [Caerostris darwini]|uniref:Uncharacterized protein n=1 Tax=Caerostris darwini TaxID=1538125 RepID=A0AAV4N0E2_9ARAC|nr:hypothetical protein CDAR_575291 [Caerostris darwini]
MFGERSEAILEQSSFLQYGGFSQGLTPANSDLLFLSRTKHHIKCDTDRQSHLLILEPTEITPYPKHYPDYSCPCVRVIEVDC